MLTLFNLSTTGVKKKRRRKKSENKQTNKQQTKNPLFDKIHILRQNNYVFICV